MNRRLVLIFVSYHTSACEVHRLSQCLASLSSDVGYAIVVNDHKIGSPIEQLADKADIFLPLRENVGYGRAINRVVDIMQEAAAQSGKAMPSYLGALNTDLHWSEGTMENALAWLDSNSDVVLAVPQLLDSLGVVQSLCKQNPTFLGLFSRRFWPERIKPLWLRRYDNWYVMADRDILTIFDVPYLSGCCMLMRSDAFLAVGGFDKRFFLYLEDADLTRSLSVCGRCVHLPLVAVTHLWGRGNHRSWRLTLVNIYSAWLYFRKWGFRFA